MIEASDDKGNIWQTMVYKGARLFVRFTPFEPEAPGCVQSVVEVAVTRNDDWRFDAFALVVPRSGAPRALQTAIFKTAFGLIRSLDDGRRIDPAGTHAPRIAELSALVH